MTLVFEAFVFGMNIGLNFGMLLVLLADVFEKVRNAFLDIIEGDTNNE